ncbi:hypothetical protein ACFE04_015984 [Oxalis oulophora]
MTLEDFFTLTEMKEGLTSPCRVEELVNVMEKEKNCSAKNIADGIRQWVAVASTFSATENKDCLDRFIQLGGLLFINGWLKDIEQHDNDFTNSFVEESIIALLSALEKLDVDFEKSISSGICDTVKNLLGCRSSHIHDRAKALLDGWKQDTVKDAVDNNIENVEAHVSDEASAKERSEPSPCETEMLSSRSSVIQNESSENVQVDTHMNEQMDVDKVEAGKTSPHTLASSVVSNSIIGDTPTMEKLPTNTFDKIETSNVPISEQGNIEEQLEAPISNKFLKDEEQLKKTWSSEKNGDLEKQENDMEPPLKDSCDTIDGDSCIGSAAVGIVGNATTEPERQTCDSGTLQEPSADGQINEEPDCVPKSKTSDSGTLQESSADGRAYEKPDSLETSFSRVEDFGAVDDDKDQANDEDEDDLGIGTDLSQPAAIGALSPDPIDERGDSDDELDFGLDHALEVARKVAQEVERETNYYREPSSSSSEKLSEGETRQEPKTPESINDTNEDFPTEVDAEDGKKNLAEVENNKDLHIINANVKNGTKEITIYDPESLHINEANNAQQSEINITEKSSMCDIDLNQEFSSDEMVNSNSAPISVVSASRPTAAPGFPAAPLQFEGALGWKGSAATSAFRPASPRRISDIGKNLCISAGPIDGKSKRKQDHFGFDLNVTEDSGDEKHDASPNRSNRLKWDLNSISDDSDDAPPPSDEPKRNGPHLNPPPPLMMMQPFDLNDRPFFSNDSADHQGKFSQNLTNAFGGVNNKRDDDEPVISIMGARVEVNKAIFNFMPRVSILPNGGKALDPTPSDVHMGARAGFLGMGPPLSYSHSPVFGYNGVTTPPGIPFSAAMYGGPGATGGGSVPYMVDSRGASVVPQLFGPLPPYSQQPFILNMSGLNGAGPSRPPSVDLNSGFAIEGGNRDPVGLRQFFSSDSGEQLRANNFQPEQLRANNFQPSSSSSGAGSLKRKEPDNSGWESYPFNYRQPPPWN